MKRREFLAPVLALPLAGAASSADPGGPSRSGTLDIGSDRQLFVDSFLIEEKTGVALKLHSPAAREVALPMEKPWEGNTSWAPVVMKDGSRYRLWYRVDPSTESEKSRTSPPYTAYAESGDGIHWERPEIGIYEFNGSKRNNLVWKGPDTNMSVLKDEKPGVGSRERYKAVVRRPGRPGTSAAMGLVSADGIHWRLIQQDPILIGGMFDSHNIVFQDPWTLRYIYYGRGTARRVRRIRRSSSEDFIHWATLEYVDMGEAPVDHLYTNAATPYVRARGIYLMFPKRFVPERTFFNDWPHRGQSDIVFASSRDGRHWDRTFLEAFVRPGLDPKNWHDRAITMGQGIVETSPTELSMYYVEHYRTDTCRIRRCTMRPDGFVSVHAPYSGGKFVTKPLRFRGKHLWINYATSAVGFVKVEIQDASGKPISNFGMQDSTEIFGDELERKVTWGSNASVQALASKTVRLRFSMKDADLYSFRFDGA